MSLTFQKLAETNYDRATTWHPGGLSEWTVSDWAVAMAGECGEICDAVKKLNRLEIDLHSNNVRQPADREAAVKAIAQEIGDTLVYMDLLAQRLDLNLEDCVRDTFNRISVRENLPQRL